MTDMAEPAARSEKPPARRPRQAEKGAAARSRSLTAQSLRRLARNRAAMAGAIVIAINILAALFAPLIAPRGYADASLPKANAIPIWLTKIFPGMTPVDEGGYVRISNDYPLGADQMGRDMLSRMIYGARVSLSVALVGPLISVVLGFLIGLLAGYSGGWLDNLLMRFVDIMFAFPSLLLTILLMSFFRAGVGAKSSGLVQALSKADAGMGGLLFIFIGIGMTAWMGTARMVRGQVLSVRESEYVLTAYSIGVPTHRIVLRHILPNIVGPLIVTVTMAIPGYITTEAFLSFIGLGVNPPTPSWGGMISEGAIRLQSYPNQALFPALALFLLIFAFNFLGDGLRDALDPTLSGRE